jgi:hypothetical protein
MEGATLITINNNSCEINIIGNFDVECADKTNKRITEIFGQGVCCNKIKLDLTWCTGIDNHGIGSIAYIKSIATKNKIPFGIAYCSKLEDVLSKCGAI